MAFFSGLFPDGIEEKEGHLALFRFQLVCPSAWRLRCDDDDYGLTVLKGLKFTRLTCVKVMQYCMELFLDINRLSGCSELSRAEF